MTSNLISKNIDNYFNELIKKPITIIPKKESSLNIFYKNYIEHNLLLIFIIIFISIFLLFKYYSKENDDDNDNIDYKKEKEKEKEKEITKSKNDNIKKINKLKRKKEQLAKEKNEILSIIDELSELNFEKCQNINNSIDNNNNNKNYSKEITYDDVNEETISNYIDEEIIKLDAYKNNNLKSEDYYNITEKNSELINGMYFETPYN